MNSGSEAKQNLAVAAEHMLDRAPRGKILCVGDLMLDRFVTGQVERISPEAPIPVLAVDRETAMPGGVGNVVSNIRSLDGLAHVVAVVGEDSEAQFLEGLLGPPENLSFVRDPTRQTAVKTRFIAGGQQLLRADYELRRPIGPRIEEQIVDEIEKHLRGAAVLILSDYGKGVLTDRVLSRAIAAAKAEGIPTVVDPKGPNYARYRGATVVTPNLKELAEVAGSFGPGDAKLEEAARSVLAKSGIVSMVATRGAEGLSAIRMDADAVHIRARAREVFDVSGAGDTVVATLGLALATGADLATGAALANLAASIVVGKVGTASVSADELRAAADEVAGSGKLKTLHSLIDQVERWRRRHLTVGFTNGCFDLLHPGHLSLIRQSRATCDRLIVAINSDASVKRLKGPARPVSTELARAEVLSALTDVDAVAIFDEDTPLTLIEAVKPDVLIKGADYAIDQIVGAPFVQSYGGRVVRAQLEAGHSTTATIGRMIVGE